MNWRGVLLFPNRCTTAREPDNSGTIAGKIYRRSCAILFLFSFNKKIFVLINRGYFLTLSSLYGWQIQHYTVIGEWLPKMVATQSLRST